jgi:predicted metalloprotease with PDZ domain
MDYALRMQDGLSPSQGFSRAAGALIAVALHSPCCAAHAEVTSTPIRYTIRLDAPQTQMVDIEIEVRHVDQPALEFMLPAWRPGRYEILDPAGTVSDVRASAPHDKFLAVEKIDKATWRVASSGEPIVRLHYRVYANSLNDRTRHVDDTHAFISPAAVLMYVPDRRAQSVQVRIELPPDHPDWRIASGLERLPADPRTLTARNYDVLVDSPLEIGVHDVLEFDVGEKSHEIVIWGRADYDADTLKADFAKIVESQAAIFRSLPYERFVFITHIGAGASGGTEHLNSTVIQASRAALEDDDAYQRFLGLVSHEMFHTWNVKQFRPRDIHPYDYQRENYSKLFWVAEGTTSYYDDLTLVHAKLKKPDDYLKILGEAIDALRKRPGGGVQSLEESSFDAWIKFNKPNPDSVNSTISFYDKGALVSLLLDLTIRRLTDHQRSLDDVMLALYEQFPITGPGYTPVDFVKIVKTTCASIEQVESPDAEIEQFFEDYVRGTKPLEFEQCFDSFGLALHLEPAKEREDKENGGAAEANNNQGNATTTAYLGLKLTDQDGRAMVSSVLSDGPAYQAGVLAGDEVLALDGRRLNAGDLSDRLKKLKPGELIALTLFRRDELRTISITLAQQPNGSWKVRRAKEPTEQQKLAYAGWLKQSWPEDSDQTSDE